MNYTVSEKDDGLKVENLSDFNLDQIFDCGQCFRFEKKDSTWSGVAFNRILRATSLSNDSIFLHNMNFSDFENIWVPFFDLNRDYTLIKKQLSCDLTMKNAIEYAPGIRLLVQDSWEALCSFIISQNNNIPRIKLIISRLCEMFGEKIDVPDELKSHDNVINYYSFPTSEKIASLSKEDLAPLKAGFRDRYILDCANKIVSGEVDFKTIENSSYDDALKELLKIVGVGKKVADCTLLYGFERVNVFPIDTWIKKALSALYPEGFPIEFESIAGIAQQYLFHYVRNNQNKVFMK